MALIATVNGKASGATTVTRTTLTGADTLLVKSGITQVLVLENTGVATPTINIDGGLASTVNCRGIGDPIDVSGGFDIPLAAGAVKTIPLSSIAAYTNDAANTPAVTGGTADVLAYIIEL